MSRVLLSCLGLGAAAALTLTGGSVAGAFAVGLGGNLATDFYKFLHRRVAERFLDGWSGIDENHHVNRALRLAQIDGLRAVLKRFDSGWACDPDPGRHQEAERFSGVLKDFLDQETKAAQTLAFSSGVDVSAEEQTIRCKVLQTLPDAFDQGLATRRATGDRSAMLASLKQVRVAVEVAVLEEIRLQTLTKDEDFPPLFNALFEGKGQSDGWFDLFIRDAAAKIKEGTEFEKVWNAEQTAMIKAIAEANSAVLDLIDGRTAAMQQEFAKFPSVIETVFTGIQAGSGLRSIADGVEALARELLSGLERLTLKVMSGTQNDQEGLQIQMKINDAVWSFRSKVQALNSDSRTQRDLRDATDILYKSIAGILNDRAGSLEILEQHILEFCKAKDHIR